MTARDDFYRQFQEYLRIVYEGRWYIITIFVVVVTATWFYTMQQDDIYRSSATIRLKRAMDPMNYQMTQGLGAQDLGWGGERIIANEIRVVRSEEVANKVADKLLVMVGQPGAVIDTLPILKARNRPSTFRKIARSLGLEHLAVQLGLAEPDTVTRMASRSAISGRVRGQVSISPVSGLDFIEISAESVSPVEAAHIANLMVEAYRRRNLDAARENVTTARTYLEEQLGTKKDSLTRAENELRSFQQNEGLVSLDQETSGIIAQISSFEAQREQAKVELEAANRVLSEVQKQLQAIEPTLAKRLTEGADPILKQLLADKTDLEVKIQLTEFNRKQVLKNRPDLEQYTDKDLNDLRRRYDAVLKKIDQTTKQILESSSVTGTPLDYARELRQKIITQEIEIESKKATLTGLDRVIRDYSRKFESIPAQSIEFARLERRRLSYEKLAQLLDGKHQEALINEQTTLGSVDIVDRAGVPRSPVRPNRPLNMLIGILVALGLGLGVAIGVRYLDNTIRNPEDVEKVGLPVLTFVPTFGSEAKGERSQSLITLNAPQSPPSEAYRTLRTSLENAIGSTDGKATVAIVTSPAPKEGKSTAIANLAVSAANSGRRVLLLDADLRRPVQHQIFELEREPGLSNCLVGEVPINQGIKKTIVPGLHLATCGHIPSHPAELLGSQRMEKFLELVRGYYDLILIDSPPVIAMADTLVISRFSDGVVLVVSADSTKTLGLQKAHELLEANNARVVGVVVNRFNANKIYYSYYRYYYQNYYYYSDDGGKKKRRREKVEA